VANWVDDEVATRWAAFAVDGAPRSIVLLDDRVQLDGGGFVDDESKMAWLDGAIEAHSPTPNAELALLPSRRQGDTETILRITGVTRTVAPFLCDRGPRSLPAYRLQMTGLQGSCVVLAPEAECWWPVSEADQRRGPGGAATINQDDVTIHFPAFGGVLTEFHRAEFQEHATYVVGRAITSERRVPPGTAVVALGVTRDVTGRLTAPLGGRMLLNMSGQPLAVTPNGVGP
jgi:hypothetical protein